MGHQRRLIKKKMPTSQFRRRCGGAESFGAASDPNLKCPWGLCWCRPAGTPPVALFYVPWWFWRWSLHFHTRLGTVASVQLLWAAVTSARVRSLLVSAAAAVPHQPSRRLAMGCARDDYSRIYFFHTNEHSASAESSNFSLWLCKGKIKDITDAVSGTGAAGPASVSCQGSPG